MDNSNLNLQGKLKEFHLKYGHYIQERPGQIPLAVKNLRINLIREEFEELISAIENDDLIEIADGAADLVYVVVGTCVSMGIQFDRVFSEVHNSNMTKTAIPVKDASSGEKYGTKTPKGPNYIPPDINRILYHPSEMTNLEMISK